MTDPRQLLDDYAASIMGTYHRFEDDAVIPMVPAGKAFAALRAVLKLHAPIPNVTPPWCMHCSGGEHVEMWPCPTVRAITTALEAS